MPHAVYSVTFLRLGDVTTWHRYTVPSGKRAVVKNVTVQVFDNLTAQPQVLVAGRYIVLVKPQVARETKIYNTMVVAYAGEVIEAITTGSACDISVSGYLLTETDAAVDGGYEDETEVLELPQQLPSPGPR